MLIRPFRSTDFQRLYEIDQAAFAQDIAYSKLELQFYIQSRDCRTLVVEDSNKVLGFVIGCTEPRNLGHIITIDVAPNYQRQQIGSRMLQAVEEFLWEGGAEAIYLETPVDDTGARAFYEKHGYFIFQTIPGYYNGTLDGYVMIKTNRQPVATSTTPVLD